MTGANPLTSIADHIRELTEPYRNVEREHYWDDNRNRKSRLLEPTWHKPLLAQLRDAITPGQGAAGPRAGKGKRSAHPSPANLDALCRLDDINTELVRWRHRLDVTTPPTPPGDDWVRVTLRALVGAAATAGSRTLDELDRAVNEWHTWCSILGGWEEPPWRPNAPCPNCDRLPGHDDNGKPTGLRVRLDQHTALCMSCRATWTPDTIGVLGRHVGRYLNAAAKAKAEALATPQPRSFGGRA